jgi:hypothetical protein
VYKEAYNDFELSHRNSETSMMILALKKVEGSSIRKKEIDSVFFNPKTAWRFEELFQNSTLIREVAGGNKKNRK